MSYHFLKSLAIKMSQPNPYASHMLQPGQTYTPGQIWNLKGREVKPAAGTAGMTLADKMKEREALVFPYPEPKKMDNGNYYDMTDQAFSFNPMPDPMSATGLTKYSSQDEHFTPISPMVDVTSTSMPPTNQSSGSNVDVVMIRYLISTLKHQMQQMNNSIIALEAVLSTTK